MTEKRKYRGLTKDGKWVYGYYAHFEIRRGWMVDFSEYDTLEMHLIFPEPTDLADPYNSEGTIHRASYYQVIPETVGQSIGIKDKNGKKIYEGDITNLGIVEWNDERMGFLIDGMGIEIYDTETWPLEIIGTIHENPELLENK